MRSLALMIMLLSLLPVAADGGEFQAGASVADITPPLGELIVGGWRPFPAKKIHDRLHARSLVFKSGATSIGFVVCDNVGIPTEVFDAARKLIPQDKRPSYVMMSSTHTHSATTARGPTRLAPTRELSGYQKQLAQGIADSIVKAVDRLEPAELAFGTANEPSEVFCRRWFMAPGFPMNNPFGGTDQVRMNPPRGHAALLRPSGPTDPEISFIAVRSTSDHKPLALMANYSLHYVGGVPAGEVSADYFAVFANRMAELLEADNDFVGIMTNGTSGNINNINFNKRSPRREPYSKMTEVANKVAGKVFESWKTLKFKSEISGLGQSMSRMSVAVRKPTPEMLDHFKKIDAKPTDEKPAHSRERIYSDRMRTLVKEPDELEFPVGCVYLDDIVIAPIPFEVFSQIGLEIKDKSGFPNTFVVSLANGSFGYLPTPEEHKLGGYETWLGTNYVEKNASRMITEQILQSISKARSSIKATRK